MTRIVWLDALLSVSSEISEHQRKAGITMAGIQRGYRARLVVVPLLIALVSGCGGGAAEVPPLGTVSGVVTVDGTPVEDARVEFIPVAGGRPSTALTDASGKYTLTYSDGIPGAAVGSHKVAITTERAAFSPEGGEGTAKEARLEMLPPEYNDESTLTQEVKEGENLDVNFSLETKGFKPGTKRRPRNDA